MGAPTVSATTPISIYSFSPNFQTQILDSGWSSLLDLPGLLKPSKSISNIPFNPTPNQKPRPTCHQFKLSHTFYYAQSGMICLLYNLILSPSAHPLGTVREVMPGWRWKDKRSDTGSATSQWHPH